MIVEARLDCLPTEHFVPLTRYVWNIVILSETIQFSRKSIKISMFQTSLKLHSSPRFISVTCIWIRMWVCLTRNQYGMLKWSKEFSICHLMIMYPRAHGVLNGRGRNKGQSNIVYLDLANNICMKRERGAMVDSASFA